MENFTPWSALLGGALLGLSATVLLLTRGRIAGISGILGGLIKPEKGNTAWRLSFLVGMLLAPVLLMPLGYQLPQIAEAPSLWIVGAGLLVGIGTKLANGCTSGHGICGLSRLSRRSMVATGIFMFSAIVVVALRFSLGGL